MSNASEKMTRETREWAASLTIGRRHAIERWQGADRFYLRVQAVVETGVADDEAEEVADRLLAATNHRLWHGYRAWRGIRSCRRVFGVDSTDLELLIGTQVRTHRFMSTTFDLDVVTAEFLTPSGVGGPPSLRF